MRGSYSPLPSWGKGAGGARSVLALLYLGDVAWLAVWSATLGPWLGGSGPVLDAPVVALLVAAGALLPRWLFGAGDGAADRASRLAAGVLGLAAALVATARYWFFPSHGLNPGAVETLALFGIVLALVGWWRGLVLGRGRADVATVEESFRLGVGALCLLLALVAVGGGSRPDARTLVVPTFLFLGAGLVALPLARVIEVSDLARRREGRGFGAGGTWLGLLVGVVVALLVLTLLLANLATFERIDALLRPIDEALSALLYVVLLPFAYLFAGLFYLIAPLIGRREAGEEQTMDPGGALLEALRDRADLATGLPAEILLLLKALVAVGLAVGVVYVLARSLSRFRGRSDADETAFVETRELLWRWPGWRVALGLLFEWLFGRFRRRAASVASEPAASPADALSPGSVRALYREFLALAASLGRPRRPSETPAEYAARVLDSLPGEGEVGEITDGYVRARYARPPEAATDERSVGLVAAALARLRALWGERDEERPR